MAGGLFPASGTGWLVAPSLRPGGPGRRRGSGPGAIVEMDAREGNGVAVRAGVVAVARRIAASHVPARRGHHHDLDVQARLAGPHAEHLVDLGHEAGQIAERAGELGRVPFQDLQRRQAADGQPDHVRRVSVEERVQVVRGGGDVRQQRGEVGPLGRDRLAGDAEVVQRLQDRRCVGRVFPGQPAEQLDVGIQRRQLRIELPQVGVERDQRLAKFLTAAAQPVGDRRQGERQLVRLDRRQQRQQVVQHPLQLQPVRRTGSR